MHFVFVNIRELRLAGTGAHTLSPAYRLTSGLYSISLYAAHDIQNQISPFSRLRSVSQYDLEERIRAISSCCFALEQNHNDESTLRWI